MRLAQLTKAPRSKFFVWFFFTAFFLLGSFIFKDYGLSWDEGYQRQIGEENYRYIFYGERQLFDPNTSNQYYGPFFELILYIAEFIFRLKDSRTIFLMRHFLNFCCFFLGVIFFYLIAKLRFRSRKAGLLACTFLILTPRIFAHSFFNSKDIPFLVASIINVYFLIKYLQKPRLLWATINGVTSAILINQRIIGLFFPVLTIFMVGKEILINPAWRMQKKLALLSLLQFVLICLFCTFLFFPASWEDPLHHFPQAFRLFSKNPCPVPNLYFGQPISSLQTPWHYVPVWILITTPIFYTFCFLAGLAAVVMRILKRKHRQAVTQKNQIIQISFLWFFLPIASAILLKSNFYNGWRHMFFIYPAFLLIALEGFTALSGRIKKCITRDRNKIMAIVLIVFAIYSLGDAIIFSIKNHPYQNFYFNDLAGRNLGVSQNFFNVDYWGLAKREILETILNNDTAPQIKIYGNEGDLPVKLNALILKPEQRERIVFVQNPEEADYLIGYNWWSPFFEEVYAVEVEGAKVVTAFRGEAN